MFKVCDKVKCISNVGMESLLTIGKEYLVHSIDNTGTPAIYVLADNGIIEPASKHRFILATQTVTPAQQQAAVTPTKAALKKGDRIFHTKCPGPGCFCAGSTWTIDFIGSTYPSFTGDDILIEDGSNRIPTPAKSFEWELVRSAPSPTMTQAISSTPGAFIPTPFEYASPFLKEIEASFKTRCECGAHAVRHSGHSSWCPLYE